jgi:hypothetical protein
MKETIIVFAVLLSMSVALADEEKVVIPKALANSKIERVLENGKKQEFDGNEYEIVKRHKPRKVVKTKPKPPVAVESCKVPEPVIKEVEVIKEVRVVEQIEPKKNRLSLLAGKGAVQGLDRSDEGSTVEVSSRVGIIGALQYQRLLTEKVSAGIQVQSSRALLLELGLDF